MRIGRWVVLAGLVGACGDGAVDPAQDEPDPRFDPRTWPEEVGPAERPAALLTPNDWAPAEGLPLVVVLHGYGATGDLQQRFFRLGERVDQGFAVLVPDGTEDLTGKRFWNATDACCNFGNSDVDDVGYLLSLIDAVEAEVAIDPDRIVFVGHSNGGFMSYRMACEAPERIAGIASLAGANFDDPEACGASEAVSVLQIHGTADDTIGYEGGQIRNFPPTIPSAVDSVQYWADLAGCGTTTEDGPYDYEAWIDGEDTTRLRWQACGAHDMQLWSIEGGEHIPTPTAAFDDALLEWLLAQRRGA